MLKAPPPRRRGRASSVCSCVRMTGVAQGQGRLVGHRGVNQEAGAVSVAESGGWWSSLLGLSMGSCDLGPGPEATQLSGLGGWGAGVAPGCGRHGQEAGPSGAGRGGVTGCPGKHSIPRRGAGRVGAAPGAGWGGGGSSACPVRSLSAERMWASECVSVRTQQGFGAGKRAAGAWSPAPRVRFMQSTGFGPRTGPPRSQ